jgi:hypothetical protein
MKYVLVTGGVVSGLGKGVTASSIGVALKSCGLRITSIKIGTCRRLLLLLFQQNSPFEKPPSRRVLEGTFSRRFGCGGAERSISSGATGR